MLQPLNGLVYVMPDAPIEKKGMIVIPPTNHRQTSGIVRASDSPLCKKGDHVSYARFYPIEFNCEEIVVVSEKDLLGVDTELMTLPAPSPIVV